MKVSSDGDVIAHAVALLPCGLQTVHGPDFGHAASVNQPDCASARTSRQEDTGSSGYRGLGSELLVWSGARYPVTETDLKEPKQQGRPAAAAAAPIEPVLYAGPTARRVRWLSRVHDHLKQLRVRIPGEVRGRQANEVSEVWLVHTVLHPHSVELVACDPRVIQRLPQRLDVVGVLRVVRYESKVRDQSLHIGRAVRRLDKPQPLHRSRRPSHERRDGVPYAPEVAG